MTTNKWEVAIDHALVSAGIGAAHKDPTLMEATKKLNELLNWHYAVATDHRVNGGYVLVPIEPTEAMLEAGRQTALRALDNENRALREYRNYFPAVYAAMIKAAQEGT